MPRKEFNSVSLLIIGACLGLLMVIYDGFFKNKNELLRSNPHAVAYVNDHPILREDYQAMLAMLESDKRNSLEATDKARALQRLIDEELLIQHGLSMGLVEQDVTVRKAISTAMISVIKLQMPNSEPAQAELQKFYAENLDYFTSTDQLTIKRFVADTAENVLRITNQWRQTGQADSFVDDPIRPLPSGALSPKVLREYIGSSALQAVQSITEGEMTEPLAYGNLFQILLLQSKNIGDAPEYNVIEDAVRFDFLRQQDEKAMSDYLRRLRNNAEISILPEAGN